MVITVTARVTAATVAMTVAAISGICCTSAHALAICRVSVTMVNVSVVMHRWSLW